MFTPQQPADNIWTGDKFPGARLCPGMKECNDAFFKAMKQHFKTRWLIGAGYNSLCPFFIFLLLSFSRVEAQHESDYAVHANIIYHFTKYIDWPEYKKSGDFIIGIIGDTPLYDEMNKNIAGKMAGDQKIIIKRFSPSASSFSCHILFVSEDESSRLKKIAVQTAGAAILLVSESEGLAQKGGCINFVIVSDHLKLEINKNNIVERGLSVASELLQLGKVVK